MSIEENIERIANALERIASAQEENVRINASYKAFLTEREARHIMENGGVQDDPLANGAVILPDGAVTPKTETPAPASVMAAPSGPVITQEMIEASAYVTAHPTALTALGKDLAYDELKVELLARAHAYKKGTKLTTLQKEWDLHKHEPIIGAKPTPITLAEPQTDVNPAGYAPSLTEAPAPAPTPAPAPAPVQDPFGTDSAPASTPAPMTKDEAYKRISRSYNSKDPKCVDAVVAALRKVGAQTFSQVQEGQFEVVVAEYERLKGITNA